MSHCESQVTLLYQLLQEVGLLHGAHPEPLVRCQFQSHLFKSGTHQNSTCLQGLGITVTAAPISNPGIKRTTTPTLGETWIHCEQIS